MTPVLRPLSLGEMLDRALALALRTALRAGAVFAPALGAALLAAAAIAFGAQKLHAPSRPAFALAALVALGFLAFGLTAALSGQIAAYLGEPVRIRAMLAAARRSWFQLALAALLVALIVALPAGAFVALYQAGVWTYQHAPFFAHSRNDAAAALCALAFGLAAVAVSGFALCAGGVALVGCVAESSAAPEALRRGWTRSVAGGRLRRTFIYGALVLFVGMGVALALQLIAGGIVSLLGLAVNASEGLAYATIAGEGLAAVFQFLYVTFQWAWAVVYYFDLRVRSEGLDLALRSESLGGLATGGSPAK